MEKTTVLGLTTPPHVTMSNAAAIAVLNENIGQAILIPGIVTQYPDALVKEYAIDPKINAGRAEGQKVAFWQADTAWSNPKAETPPSCVDRLITNTNYDQSVLPKAANVILLYGKSS